MERFTEPINLLFREGNPTGAKCMAKVMGLTSNEVRLPLVEGSEALQRDIENIVKAYDLK